MKQNIEHVSQATGNDEVCRNPMQKLEDALEVCKFGRFHFQLMIATLLSVLATTSVTTATSYILPSAECDLNMSLFQKGLLNAMPFLGQFCASLFTGFITDAFGRKIFLVGGNFGLLVCTLFGASSQTYVMLLVGKLLEGILMSLVFTATASMITEFTPINVRNRVLLAYSAFMSLSIIIMSLVSWAVLSLNVRLVLIEGYFEIHPWNIYLYTNSAWSLLAAILYWQLPESPKFLLSHGQENEALQILKRIYRTNTGKEDDSFPIKSLNISGINKPENKICIRKQLVTALFDVKELFRPPLGYFLMLFSTITFVCLLAYSALRLWFPQLSTIIETYQNDHDGHSNQFCVMLEYRNHYNTSVTTEFNQTDICIPKLSGSETYTNGAILGFVSLICISFSGYLVDHLGQKPLMFAFIFLCSICSGTLYWTNSSFQVAILISLTCAFMQTGFSLMNSILVRVFPTTVRTTALSVIMMVGRAGSLIGNIVFPIMLDKGCMVPFVTLSAVTFCTAGMVYFLPNPEKENSNSGDK